LEFTIFSIPSIYEWINLIFLSLFSLFSSLVGKIQPSKYQCLCDEILNFPEDKNFFPKVKIREKKYHFSSEGNEKKIREEKKNDFFSLGKGFPKGNFPREKIEK
jgi:hypothetical protein